MKNRLNAFREIKVLTNLSWLFRLLNGIDTGSELVVDRNLLNLLKSISIKMTAV